MENRNPVVVFVLSALVFGAVACPLYAQSGQMPADHPATNFVISSSGGDTTVMNSRGAVKTVSWNIGEPIIEEYGSDEEHDLAFKRLTQGFEQYEGYIYIPDPFFSDPDDPLDPKAAANEIFRTLGFTLQYYPNPTRGPLKIKLAAARDIKFQLELHNLSGLTIWREERSCGEFEIDLSARPAGVYLLTAKAADGAQGVMFKIIKQ